MLSGNEYYNYTNSEKYVTSINIKKRMQLNSGPTPRSSPVQYIGLWPAFTRPTGAGARLVADFDNDGFKRSYYTNGLPKVLPILIILITATAGRRIREIHTGDDSAAACVNSDYAFKK